MGTLHQQFVIMLIIGITTSLQADFFLFRKMEHPATKKIVCLLYDVHASAISDAQRVAQLDSEIKKSITDVLSSAKLSSTFMQDIVLPLEEKIQSTADQLKGYLPHLQQQQKDLMGLIDYCSLIIEDWFNAKNYIIAINFNSTELNGYFGLIAGKNAEYGQIIYRKYVSPMLGIGKRIAGSFSYGEFIAIDSKYFYNPDPRGGTASGGGPEAVDNNSIKAIDQLFGKYNQSIVVVAEGYDHIVAIAKMLENKGYRTTKLIMSDDLLRRSQLNKKLSDFLEDLKNNIEPKLNEEENISGIASDWVYFLVADPLDLRKVFAEEFPGIFKEDALLSLQNNLSLMGL